MKKIKYILLMLTFGFFITGEAFAATCDQVFENNFVRYNRSYQFSDTMSNNKPGAQDLYLNTWTIDYVNPQFLGKGATYSNGKDWDWTQAVKNASYKIPKGTSNLSILSTFTNDWSIVKHPTTRTNGNMASHDFMISYNIGYDHSNNYPIATDDLSHTECIYYSVTWCGDGKMDTDFGEQCDDGNMLDGDGCSSTCKNVPIPTCNAGITGAQATPITATTTNLCKIAGETVANFSSSKVGETTNYAWDCKSGAVTTKGGNCNASYTPPAVCSAGIMGTQSTPISETTANLCKTSGETVVNFSGTKTGNITNYTWNCKSGTVIKTGGNCAANYTWPAICNSSMPGVQTSPMTASTPKLCSNPLEIVMNFTSSKVGNTTNYTWECKNGTIINKGGNCNASYTPPVVTACSALMTGEQTVAVDSTNPKLCANAGETVMNFTASKTGYTTNYTWNCKSGTTVKTGGNCNASYTYKPNVVCDQTFENNFLRYDRSYDFYDTITNSKPGSQDLYLNSWTIDYGNPEYLDKGAVHPTNGKDWDWTIAVKNAFYKIPKGTENLKILSTYDNDWRIAKHPITRTNGNIASHDFMIAYKIGYDYSGNYPIATDDLSHTECIYYSVTWCGDGKMDTDFGEQCDDGNMIDGDGCSNTCKSGPVCNAGVTGTQTSPISSSTPRLCGNSSDTVMNFSSSTSGTTTNYVWNCKEGTVLKTGGNCSASYTPVTTSSSGGGSSSSSSSSSSSGGGGSKNYCGDGRVQRPNSYGVNEECDFGMASDWMFCNKNCTYKNNTIPGQCQNNSATCNLTTPNGGEMVFGPTDKVIIGAGMNPYIAHSLGRPYIRNNSDYDLFFDEICVVKKSGTTISGFDNCEPAGIIKAGTTKYYPDVPNFVGKTITSGNYGDNKLITTIKHNGVRYDTAYFTSNLDVRVSRSSIATTGGGTSYLSDSSSIGNITDVANNGKLKSSDNKNFVGVGVSKGNISSYTNGVSGTSVTTIEKLGDKYSNSINKVSDTSGTSLGDTSLLSEFKNYNGIENVFILKNKNFVVDSDTLFSNLSGSRTYIIENGNLKINKNITCLDNIAFVVKGGNIQISKEVGRIDGTYITIAKDGIGGKFQGTGGASLNVLNINGSLYGNINNLVANRTYVKQNSSDQIDVGTIVSFGSKMFRKPAPLISTFINEYLQSEKISK